MNTRRHLALMAALLCAVGVACESQHSGTSAALTPTPVPGTPNTTGGASLTGTWTSRVSSVTGAAAPATMPDVHGCSDFQWTVSSQTLTTVSGTFSVFCADSIAIAGIANGTFS